MSGINIQTEDAADQSRANIKSSGKAAHVLNVGLPPGTLIAETYDLVADADVNGVVEVLINPPAKGVELQVRPTAGSTPDPDEAYLVTMSAANAGQADTFLTETNAAPREQIRLDDGIQTRSFDGGTIDRLYLKGVGTTPALTVTVGRVS